MYAEVYVLAGGLQHELVGHRGISCQGICASSPNNHQVLFWWNVAAPIVRQSVGLAPLWNAVCNTARTNNFNGDGHRMDPQQLSRELRKGSSPDMTRRRWIIGLNLIGVTMGQIVAIYQTGIVRQLPDPPGSLFDATRVDASEYAYRRLRTPDALIMIVSYGATAWLAGAGGLDRARDNPLLPIAMGLKTLGDAAVALELAREEWQENQAFCEYCQVATLASIASVVLAVPEVARAVRYLRDR